MINTMKFARLLLASGNGGNQGSKILGNYKLLLRQEATKSAPDNTMTGHKPNNLEKKLLVWLKRFPTEADVPAFVSQSMMEKVRSQARIRLNMVLCAATAVVAFILVRKSKKSAERGDTIEKQNAELHKQYLKKN